MNNLTQAEQEQIVDLYDREWSITSLAKRFGCARTCINRLLRSRGLVVETRERDSGAYLPTTSEIEQATLDYRKAHLKLKKESTARRFGRRLGNIRMVKITADKNGIYLEPV